MRILVTGGAGMIGRKLIARLAADANLRGQPIEHVTSFDIVEGEAPTDAPFGFEARAGDLRDSETVKRLVDDEPDAIFHLAAVVSGEAEKDFDKGYGINLEGTRHLLESVRQKGSHPRFVFASSIAVFGAPFPEAIGDEFFCTPLTSYGTQKAIGELLISDYSRREILNGISIRLPTICVRPGKPNAAASGFFSNIIREPLAGEEAVLPVSEDVRHWHASPRAAIGFLLHAATIDLDTVGARRALTMPGLSVTIGEQIAALREVAGEKVVARIRHEPDDFTQKIVAGWPRNFDASRAQSLGFSADSSFAEIIRNHIEDELGGEIA
ncbi:MAG: SDR family oxidoreductase [Planctomycetales bacterium]|nr:SDR family oxidoreductase [Planctomycetales bacterium]